ncbi:serine/threonine-protein phosphatase 6 regulatory ankyrin repeat subunit C isoform X2 [Cloeon dipterum]|uniref:serine/threonine-protein phosphatase 6 regulatory ankyrin repeat subunit C isoform X2 n=1 Tax=Cloeon dipterum TaxID=197152 RepID=UPI0032200662
MQAAGRRNANKKAAAAASKKDEGAAEGAAGPAAAPDSAGGPSHSAGGGSSSGGDGGKDGDGPAAGPATHATGRQANAAPNLRDMGIRVLSLCAKGEYPAVDQLLKNIDKFCRENPPEDGSPPLAGVQDPVNGMTPLMYAVKDNRTSLVDRLIEMGVDLQARNHDNLQAIHIAANHSREDVVKLLCSKRGIDLTATGGKLQQTCVHMIAGRMTSTATNIAKVILNSAPKEIRLKQDVNGKIPLFLAIEVGNQSMCRELLTHLALEQLTVVNERGDYALHLAARKKDVEVARILVEYGAEVDAQNNEGQCALHISADVGDDAMVRFFFAVRASASIVDKQDRTPMHLAAEKGHASIIETLVDKFKASIWERTKDGSTLMHIASLNGHADCATMLFKKGVYLMMPNKKGARSIHTAARYGHVGIISTLLSKGEKVDVRTNDNYTALHIAVESGKPSSVETLLGFGAEVHVKGGKLLETPLHIAARVKDGDRCGLMLLKSGAGANVPTDDGQTPVHVASKYGNLATLLLLLEDGGDPLRTSKIGETPLHLACRGCRADVVRHLITFVTASKGKSVAIQYVNAASDEGASAIHYAAQVTKKEVEHPMEDKEVIRLLLESGADTTQTTKTTQETAFHYCAHAGNNDVLCEMISHLSQTEVQKALNRQTDKGWTPLLIACYHGHMELVNTLLANHARVDVFDLEGRSALHLAAEHGYINVCDALLQHKAFINSKSRIGYTALHMAAQNGYTQLVKFLVKDHIAVIDVLTLKKQTPLHLAAADGQLEVCRLLLELGASIDATDELGQKPIHVAAQNNFSAVVALFLQKHPQLVGANTKDGNTCAHIAAMRGSVRVIEELMKFDRQGVISARNRVTEATALQLAAEGGHAEVVKVLVKAGASPIEENKAGLTAVHLAAQNGHTAALEVFSTSNLRVNSKKLGVTALHVAAFCGQADTLRELLAHVAGAVKSEAPSGQGLVEELGSESGMTPLHLAAYSGNEGVVRLLLNSAGVQVESATTENGYNPLHLACFGGHIAVVGLLLSRAADLLPSTDKHGKTALHIASMHGHYGMVEVLLGQGGEINATDRNGWTPLHYAARAGCFDVVTLLTDSGASPKAETNYGSAPIWFAASEGHYDVLHYLMHREHDTYALMEDKRFVYNLMVCSKNHNNRPIEEFVLVSPAPVDAAAKLSAILNNLSQKEKERAKDLIAAGKQCEAMATELLALAAGADSAGKILNATDRRNVEFLDVLIENEQKEVIAHTVVQRYLQELWHGSLGWAAWRTMLLFFGFIICPPIWMVFSLPLGHRFNKIPIIKFMSYLTSHIYMMFLLMLVAITPIYPVVRATLLPYWYEWTLLVWLSGLLLFELTNPSDKSGLGWIKVTVLVFGIFGVAFHLLGLVIARPYWPTLMYLRNQLFALAFLLAAVQILDFLSFHYLFGPWAIIIGNLMKDLARFLAVLCIFVFGFSMHVVALNQPFRNQTPEEIKKNMSPIVYTGPFSEVKLSPISAFEKLFFAVFGLTNWDNLQVKALDKKFEQPEWTSILFKLVFGLYLLVSVVVLINLLIAMMSDTYQRIQAQSDIEWKYGLAKLIRHMHRTNTAPSPLNLVTTWFIFVLRFCKQKLKRRKRPSLVEMVGMHQNRVSARTKVAAKWLSKIKKVQVQPRAGRKDSTALSVAPISPLGSQLSFNNQQRIENVADWETIAKKYRAIMWPEEEEHVAAAAANAGQRPPSAAQHKTVNEQLSVSEPSGPSV